MRLEKKVISAKLQKGDFRPLSKRAILFRATVKWSLVWPPSTKAPSPVKSAPVIRETGEDRSAVTGGGRASSSDWLIVRIMANPGETFLDRMNRHGGRRAAAENRPNEIALDILLAKLTIVFLLATVTLPCRSRSTPCRPRAGEARSPSRAGWHCSCVSFPTTIGWTALRDRHLRAWTA
jgi:hypothetical protein